LADEETKKQLATFGKICPEKDLKSQDFMCNSCANPIARIVHNWDFKKYPVSKRAKFSSRTGKRFIWILSQYLVFVQDKAFRIHMSVVMVILTLILYASSLCQPWSLRNWNTLRLIVCIAVLYRCRAFRDHIAESD
ncbi:hypothetical protein NPIL_490181, partial [Nephila pilipes]